jgi:DNA invertase Pin-like site-specific DNA recombinase
MELYKVRSRISMGESIYDLPLKVTFYARVSTDKDVQLNSLDNQIMYFKDFIQNNKNWTYVDGYIDEGISGTSVNRREDFLRMIEDSKKGMFDLILTKEISRFSRSTLDSIKYTQELLKNNVGVLFQSDNINTIMPDSELRLTIMASIAQEEVRKLSERVKFGMKRSIEKGRVLGNEIITGYRKNKGKLEIDEKESEMIRIIFKLYSTGDFGLKNISDYLYNKGYKSSKGTYIKTTTIRRMITNPKYKGFYCTNTVKYLDYKTKKQIRLPKSEWIVYDSEGKIPAIVSPEIWDKCNKMLEERASGYCAKIKDEGVFKRRTTYGGLLYCAEHNLPMRRNKTNKHDLKATDYTWKCSGLIEHGLSFCESALVYESDLDEIFHKIIDKIVTEKEEIIKHLTELYIDSANKKNYELEIKKQEDKKNDINLKKNKLLDYLISEIVSIEEYKRRNKELEQEIIDIDRKIISLKNEKIYEKKLLERFKEIGQKIEEEIDSQDSFTKLVQLLIERIDVHKIDADRRKLQLDIYTNVLEKKFTVYNKTVLNDK